MCSPLDERFLMSERYKINTYKVVDLNIAPQNFVKIIEWVIENPMRVAHNGSQCQR